MKKIMKIIITLILIVGCARNTEIITDTKPSINSHQELIENYEYKLLIKVKDTLSKKNSVLLEADHDIITFYSIRAVEVLDAFDKDKISLDKIYHPEAITSKRHLKHKHIRPLEKNQEYILDFESSVVSLKVNEFNARYHQTILSDFISLLSLDQSVSNEDLEALSSAKHLNKIIEFKNVSHQERDIKDFKLKYTIAENDDGTSVIEFKDHQYEINSDLKSLK